MHGLRRRKEKERGEKKQEKKRKKWKGSAKEETSVDEICPKIQPLNAFLVHCMLCVSIYRKSNVRDDVQANLPRATFRPALVPLSFFFPVFFGLRKCSRYSRVYMTWLSNECTMFLTLYCCKAILTNFLNNLTSNRQKHTCLVEFFIYSLSTWLYRRIEGSVFFFNFVAQ